MSAKECFAVVAKNSVIVIFGFHLVVYSYLDKKAKFEKTMFDLVVRGVGWRIKIILN